MHYHRTDSKDPDVHVLDGCNAGIIIIIIITQHAPSIEDGM